MNCKIASAESPEQPRITSIPAIFNLLIALYPMLLDNINVTPPIARRLTRFDLQTQPCSDSNNCKSKISLALDIGQLIN